MKTHLLAIAALFCGVWMPSASAVEISKVCENSAFVAGAAFSEAASRGYEPDRGLSDFKMPYEFSVLMPSNFLIRTQSVLADVNVVGRYVIDYVVSMDVASGIVPLAKVEVTAFYRAGRGAICSLKSVSSADEL